MLQQRLHQIAASPLAPNMATGLKGLEKESLRVTENGYIAHTPHPAGLGTALTHPYITTDYSEALLEFITPPYPDTSETLRFLDEIHRFVYQCLDRRELLLATSMPIGFENDEDIPIARYGTSNIGRMKYVYRLGLAYRYGRAMQAIAGIHFNFSVATELWPLLHRILKLDCPLPTAADTAYFALIRNVQRHGWLLLYLFGASPLVDGAYLRCRGEIPPGFEALAPDSYGPPFATSLRMSDIGYRNPIQAELFISTNNLQEYVTSLCRAIETPHPRYQAIGVKKNGHYRQLNANILQIENEYYSPVRPKQLTRSGEKPTLALKRRGVRYVEIRSLDLNPYLPLGIEHHQIHFLEAFLWHCLLRESPPLTRREHETLQANLLAVALRGRDPKLTLQRDGRSIFLQDWAQHLLDEIALVCQVLDSQVIGSPYQESLAIQRRKLDDPDRTPSARILQTLQTRHISMREFALDISKHHAAHFRNRPLPCERRLWFEHLTQESIQAQERLESEDKLSFEAFLRRYFSESCQAA